MSKVRQFFFPSLSVHPSSVSNSLPPSKPPSPSSPFINLQRLRHKSSSSPSPSPSPSVVHHPSPLLPTPHPHFLLQ
ncbi:hypothetical protein ACLOJK_001345, partial [Asimina triloba]